MSDETSLGITITQTTRRRCVELSPSVLTRLSTTSKGAGLGQLAQRLEEVRGWLATDLSALETDLAALCDQSEDGNLANRAAAHLLSRPGKRIRPICVFLAAELAEVAIDDQIRDMAAACELVHAATLLHDDVIDEGDERRGSAAARTVYGNSASILGGDFLLVEALARVSRHPRGRHILPSLLDTIAQMVAAEALQLEQRGTFKPSRETYLDVIDGKTASLFRWALEAPGSLADLATEGSAALSRAGTALGMAFQLTDSVLDLAGDPDETGKSMMADLLQGKVTWPLLVAVEEDASLVAAVAALTQANGSAPAHGWTDVVARIHASGGVAATRQLARAYADDARAALTALPASRARDALSLVIDAVVARSR